MSSDQIKEKIPPEELRRQLEQIANHIGRLNLGEYVSIRVIGPDEAIRALADSGGSYEVTTYQEQSYRIESANLRIGIVDFWIQSRAKPLPKEPSPFSPAAGASVLVSTRSQPLWAKTVIDAHGQEWDMSNPMDPTPLPSITVNAKPEQGEIPPIGSNVGSTHEAI